MAQFNVTMKRTVKTVVTCECDTIEQARSNPWNYAQGELEIDQIDYEVEYVEEVK